MIRSEHRAALVIALLAAAGCAPKGDQTAAAPTIASGAAPSVAPGARVPGTPVTVAAADAARPNRVADPAQFADPATRAAYMAARDNAGVLEHIYCHCHCHENIGHRALVECFETDHGAGCDICQTEANVAAKMTAEGHAPAEIQTAIDAYYQA